MKKLFGLLVLVIVVCGAVLTQPTLEIALYRAYMSQPQGAFPVIGNIYSVGATDISSHIIVTDEGLILLDAGTVPMSSMLKENIEALGHEITDVKYIISSHAHWDHVEGLAYMQALTGAQVVALGEDALAIASGIDSSAYGGVGWEPVPVDIIIKDGEVLSFGGVELTAHLTAGHTKGCTTWTTTVVEEGVFYDVVFVGGTAINSGVNLLNNERHPSISADYAATFSFLKSIEPDVFIAQHPSLYGAASKREAMMKGAGKNPFINPEEYKSFVLGQEKIYLGQMAQERTE